MVGRRNKPYLLGRTRPIRKLLGGFLSLFSATFVAPMAVSLALSDGEFYHLATSLGIILSIGVLIWFPVRKDKGELRTRDSFIIVAGFWIGLGLLGALPFMLGPHLDFVDSVFEAVSGLTTTGATVIVGVDRLPPSILLYRQQLQWLGGAGVILLAIAVLPLMGVGGMQLFQAEVPGPESREKLAPRIAKTARSLWAIYVGLTALCALCYRLVGMSTFDAIAHSLSTISTGGFSTHDMSLAYYDSVAVETVAQIFMLLGAINYVIHFHAWRQHNLRPYYDDIEVRVFLRIIVLAMLLTTILLWAQEYYSTLGDTLRHTSFHVISVITTTGFTTSGFSGWPLALPVIYLFISFVGGCAGSTAGGMKVIRWFLLWKQGEYELKRLVHPALALSIKIGDRTADERLMFSVWGFFAVYVLTFAVLMLLVMMTGEDQVTAFSAVASSMNNLGPGLGGVSQNFTSINDAGKLITAYAMLLGRLEIFTLLVLLTPEFWRR